MINERAIAIKKAEKEGEKHKKENPQHCVKVSCGVAFCETCDWEARK